jgi:hypothetical protein
MCSNSEGHVRIYSEVGTGSVVRLYLPQSKEAAVARPAPAAAELPTGTETILLVEDDRLVRAYAAAQLSALGYHVVIAENAQRAIEAVTEGCAPDLLFTDMIMPGGMNGRDLAVELRRLWPGLLVLYEGARGPRSASRRCGVNFHGKPHTHKLAASSLTVLRADGCNGGPGPIHFRSNRPRLKGRHRCISSRRSNGPSRPPPAGRRRARSAG